VSLLSGKTESKGRRFRVLSRYAQWLKLPVHEPEAERVRAIFVPCPLGNELALEPGEGQENSSHEKFRRKCRILDGFG
jgi:hypothetical protein